MILVPVLERPGNVAPLLDSIEAATPAARVLFIADPDDRPEIEAIKADGRGWLELAAGNYATKINHAIARTSSPLIFTGADDLRFHPGWFEAAVRELEDADVVGTQDLCNPRVIRGEHATHFLVTRDFAELGQIDGESGLLCESYAHNCVDDELIGVARARGRYRFGAVAVVEHRHPMNQTAAPDRTYRKGRSSMRLDRRLLRSRQDLWRGPLEPFKATICIATYGSEEWRDLALSRALPSAQRQGEAITVHRPAGTLAEVRNAALEQVESEFVIFLDADDELEPGYFAAMAEARADLRAPSIRQIRDGRRGRPFMPRVFGHRHECSAGCLRDGNWLVIGTAVRTELLRSSGGFPEGIEWSEDWAAFARCWAAGGTVEAVPKAVYRAHMRPDSRNHRLPPAETERWHREIERLVWGEGAAA